MKTKKVELLKEHGILNPNPEKVLAEDFKSNAFFDSRDLLQVKYEMLRQVVKGGLTVTQAAKLYGLSRPTFYQVQQAFNEGGMAGLLPRQRGPRGAHKLDEEVMDFVEQAVNQDSTLRAETTAELIEKEFGFSIHPRSVERALERRKKNGKNQGGVLL